MTENSRTQVVIIGAGPSGMALAHQCIVQNIDFICLDPRVHDDWPQVFGVWHDEFSQAGFGDAIFHRRWQNAAVYLDDGRKIDIARGYAWVNGPQLKRQIIAQRPEAFMQRRMRSVAADAQGYTLTLDDGAQIQAKRVIDCRGFSKHNDSAGHLPCNSYQSAFGLLAEVDAHPFDTDAVVLMDWRRPTRRDHNVPAFLFSLPVSPSLAFFEETVLAWPSPVAMPELKERLQQRLAAMGIAVKSIVGEERCLLPLDLATPKNAEGMIYGAAAGLVHPHTGYHFTRGFLQAPAMVSRLKKDLGKPRRAAEKSWRRTLWRPSYKILQYLRLVNLHLMEALPTDGISRFFEAFFACRAWPVFMAQYPMRLGAYMMVALKLFVFHFPWRIKLSVLARWGRAFFTAVFAGKRRNNLKEFGDGEHDVRPAGALHE